MTLKWSLNPKLVALLTSNGWLVFLRPSFAEKVSGIAGHQEANTKGKFSTGPHCFLETQGEKRKVDLWKPSCCLWEYWVHELTVIHRQSSGWKADCRSVSRIEDGEKNLDLSSLLGSLKSESWKRREERLIFIFPHLLPEMQQKCRERVKPEWSGVLAGDCVPIMRPGLDPATQEIHGQGVPSKQARLEWTSPGESWLWSVACICGVSSLNILLTEETWTKTRGLCSYRQQWRNQNC